MAKTWFSLCLPLLLACGGPEDAKSPEQSLSEKWRVRAEKSYRAGDFEDASDASRKALASAPHDPAARLVAAKVSLAKLELSDVGRFTEGLTTAEAHALRGRSFWYAGDVERAADELDLALRDPDLKDPWARDVAKLARRGRGRRPFTMEGGVVALAEMPRAVAEVNLGPAHVVQVEIEGERVLALIATGVSELILDSNTRREPTWVTMRFGGRIEVRDVPALTSDLGPLSRQLGGIPIRALLGINLLRHIHATFDRRADQFVVRLRDPAPPPEASRVPLWYVRGGGMTLRAQLFSEEPSEAPLFVDSSRFFPMALGDSVWKRAGVDVRTMVAVPDVPNVRRGILPTFRLGGFDLAKFPAFSGIDVAATPGMSDVDLAGVVGAELLEFFRVTLVDEGRFAWVEVDPTLLMPPKPPASSGKEGRP